MSFKSKEDILKVYGWTIGSKLDYIVQRKKDGETKDQIYEDLVENRTVGMKSRGCYETPGGTIILHARRAIESITLDREVTHLKTEIMPKYASMIYNGFWWSPERESLQKFIDSTQKEVCGFVKLQLYKGNVIIEGRKSENFSLYKEHLATFEDDKGVYDQKDAQGFIALNALRLKNKHKK